MALTRSRARFEVGARIWESVLGAEGIYSRSAVAIAVAAAVAAARIEHPQLVRRDDCDVALVSPGRHQMLLPEARAELGTQLPPEQWGQGGGQLQLH